MQCSCAHSVKAAAHLHLLQLPDEAVAQGSKRERLQRIHKLVGRWTQVTWGALGDGLRRSAIEGGRQFLEDTAQLEPTSWLYEETLRMRNALDGVPLGFFPLRSL